MGCKKSNRVAFEGFGLSSDWLVIISVFSKGAG